MQLFSPIENKFKQISIYFNKDLLSTVGKANILDKFISNK